MLVDDTVSEADSDAVSDSDSAVVVVSDVVVSGVVVSESEEVVGASLMYDVEMGLLVALASASSPPPQAARDNEPTRTAEAIARRDTDTVRSALGWGSAV